MDEVTQQNSALVEENAATAKTLEQQARSMDERVASFRLRGDAAHAVAVPSVPESEPEQTASVADADGDTGDQTVVQPQATPRHKPSQLQPETIKRAVSGRNPVGRSRTALATAERADDWEEF
jgi:methyl-accepting chemotaxis protein